MTNQIILTIITIAVPMFFIALFSGFIPGQSDGDYFTPPFGAVWGPQLGWWAGALILSCGVIFIFGRIWNF